MLDGTTQVQAVNGIATFSDVYLPIVSTTPTLDAVDDSENINFAISNFISVVPIPTITTVTAAPNPATVGQPVTFTATVSEDPAVAAVDPASPGNVVQFLSGGTVLATVGVTATANPTQSVATWTTSTLPAGSDDVAATFLGYEASSIYAANFAPSSAGTTELINAANAPPTLTNPGDQTSTEGTSASLQLQGSDPNGGSLTYSETGLLAGLSLNPTTGLISGTITAPPANYSVTVTATDSYGLSASQSFTWTVIADTPTLANPGDQENAEGDSVSLQLQGTDPSGATLSYSETGLLAGLSLNPTTGLISGTISAPPAEYSVTVTVTNTYGLSASQTFTWTVIGAPTLANPGDQTNAEGDTISPLQLQGSDTDGGTLSYSVIGLPVGLSDNSSTGLITGTVSAAPGQYGVTATVTDLLTGLSASQTFTWTVTPGAATQLELTAPSTVTAGVPFDVTVTALDAYGNIATGYLGTVDFTSTDTAPGVQLPGTYQFQVGDQGTHTFTMVVLQTAGNQTITVDDQANDLVAAAQVVVQAGVAANDDIYDVALNQTTNVPAFNGVLENDVAPNGANLTASLVTAATNGIVTLNPDGSFAYTPLPGFTGTDSFMYAASDDEGASAVAQVTLNVLPVVSIVATDSNASQITGHPATFVISRTGSTAEDLTVDLIFGGSAQNGIDYEQLPDQVVIPAGESSIPLIVQPLDDGQAEATQTVWIQVADERQFFQSTLQYIPGVQLRASASIANKNPGVVITETGINTLVQRGGQTDSYTVQLATKPKADVTVTVDTQNGLLVQQGLGQVVIGEPARLLKLEFTPKTWDVPQTVTVSAVATGKQEGPSQLRIFQYASSKDPAYNNIKVSDVVVQVVDKPTAAQLNSAAYWQLQAQLMIGAVKGEVNYTNNPTVLNQRRTIAYANLFLNNPDLLWAGLAANASYGVGVAMSELVKNQALAQLGGVDPRRAFEMLSEGNQAIFNSIFWQFLAFQEGGIALITKFHNSGAIKDELL